MIKYIDQQDARIKKISSGNENWYLPNSGIWNERYLREMKGVLTKNRNVKEIQIILNNLPKRCHTIIDAPCGYGRISNELAKRKFNVTGIDFNPYFVRMAREDAKQQHLRVDYKVANILDSKGPYQVDAVINIFTSLGYFEFEEKNNKYIENLCSYVRPGGRLIIETINPIAIFRAGNTDLKKISHGKTVLSYQRFYDFRTATITTKIREQISKRTTFTGTHITRVYFPHELIRICGAYDCTILHVLDQHGRERDISDSHRMWLIFSKKR